ncbi:peptidase C39 family protein [Candidatus Woesearchaeota archaeon]|nr:peptidase C39 family protein [Candidatus Woesearchaeota archaeon]
MQPYRQTTRYTCAAASLAMIINHFKKDFKLNAENEFDIWHKTATLPTRGSSIYALAIYAHQHNIPLKVIVGEHEYKFPDYKFKSYKKKEIEIANFSSQLFYSQTKELNLDIDERDFTIDDVKSALQQGKIVMLRLITGIIRGSKNNKRNPHYLPIYGYKEGIFNIMDPRRGDTIVSEHIVQEAFNKVKDVKRDHRMIIFG